MARSDEERFQDQLQAINDLRNQGIVSNELCPEPDYWHWSVLAPDLLPDHFKKQFDLYGEIRLY